MNSSLSHLVLELDKLTKEEGALVAEAVKQNTTLLEFNIGDTDKIDPEVVYSIETTLRLNKVIAGLLETTGFNDHVSGLFLVIAISGLEMLEHLEVC